MMVDYSRVPVEYMRSAVERYIENGISPGSFLSAVIANNLSQAVNSADATNIQFLREWVKFFTWEVPASCWGSQTAYLEWMDHNGRAGAD